MHPAWTTVWIDGMATCRREPARAGFSVPPRGTSSEKSGKRLLTPFSSLANTCHGISERILDLIDRQPKAVTAAAGTGGRSHHA
jgi:hypothetical protein